MRCCERPLRPDDALRDGGDRDDEGTRDLLGREAAENAQRERHTSLGREHGMTRREDQPEEVIPDVLIEIRVQVDPQLREFGRVSDLIVLSLERRAAADQVDRMVPPRPHEPCARPFGHARDRPLLECGDERSCASSSAVPMSPTIRVSPAMSRADSIRQIA